MAWGPEFLLSPKPALQYQNFTWSLLNLKGLWLDCRGTHPVLCAPFPPVLWIFVLIRVFVHCMWGLDYSLTEIPKALRFLSPFPVQPQVTGLCFQSISISSKGECSFTKCPVWQVYHVWGWRDQSMRTGKNTMWTYLFPLVTFSFNKYTLCNAAFWVLCWADKRHIPQGLALKDSPV